MCPSWSPQPRKIGVPARLRPPGAGGLGSSAGPIRAPEKPRAAPYRAGVRATNSSARQAPCEKPAIAILSGGTPAAVARANNVVTTPKANPNQASYGSQHVERLELIRALREVAGLPLEAIARVTRELDRGWNGDPFGEAMRALHPTRSPI